MSKFWLGGGHHSSELYDEIISLRNLFLAWSEFKKKGKLKKEDIAIFAADLEENIFKLHEELKLINYHHSGYNKFVICDPKRRIIHKACVKDRLLHHAIFRVLYPLFDKTFIFDSYSSRENKGIHKAILRFKRFSRKVSRNNTKTIYILKCDIRKFFDNVDHKILFRLLKGKIKDRKVLHLLWNIIGSFETEIGKGIPLGNLTSQLSSNVYLNNFDHYVKRTLRVKYYARYSDDFVILSDDKDYLDNLLPTLRDFLEKKLLLLLHPNKISIRKWHQGIDFLGFVSYPSYEILRTKTRRRIFKKIESKKTDFNNGVITENKLKQTVQSFKGILKHCKGLKIKRRIKEIAGLRFYKSK